VSAELSDAGSEISSTISEIVENTGTTIQRAADVDDVCRLSPMQAGLLFQTVFDSGSTAYFVQMAYRLRGRLDVETFAQAWRALGERQRVLDRVSHADGVCDGLAERVAIGLCVIVRHYERVAVLYGDVERQRVCHGVCVWVCERVWLRHCVIVALSQRHA
jgi:hypothetical protein